jgi:hypothetical protein
MYMGEDNKSPRDKLSVWNGKWKSDATSWVYGTIELALPEVSSIVGTFETVAKVSYGGFSIVNRGKQFDMDVEVIPVFIDGKKEKCDIHMIGTLADNHTLTYKVDMLTETSVSGIFTSKSESILLSGLGTYELWKK